ncbi:hypothetical protein KJ632_04465 [Patescibacteria group bacterium]|nr:hypothetical protein [Patescibacteria group bacterium]
MENRALTALMMCPICEGCDESVIDGKSGPERCLEATKYGLNNAHASSNCLIKNLQENRDCALKKIEAEVLLRLRRLLK